MALSALPLFHRVAGQRVVVVGDGPAADAKRRLVERAGAICCGEPEAHHARMAFVAVEDSRLAEATAIRLRCKSLLVNVTDRPELCDFTVPSLLERDPLVIAVGTAGASAGLAKQVRLRLEQVLPQSLGILARALFAAREEMRLRWQDPAERRHALDTALGAGGSLDTSREHDEDSVARWLAQAGDQADARTFHVELSSHDPEDLTLRQARLLGQADVVVHDEEVPEAILIRARADAIRILSGSASLPHGKLTVVLRGPG